MVLKNASPPVPSAILIKPLRSLLAASDCAFGDKLAADDKSTLEGHLEALNAAIEGGDANDMKAKMETLAEANMKIGDALYQTQQAEAEATETSEQAAPDETSEAEDDIVDADFEEVDEANKNKSA